MAWFLSLNDTTNTAIIKKDQIKNNKKEQRNKEKKGKMEGERRGALESNEAAEMNEGKENKGSPKTIFLAPEKHMMDDHHPANKTWPHQHNNHHS